MKKNLLLLAVMIMNVLAFGQNVKLEVPITKTGETQIEVEDENDVVIDTITISISTDDAEQENDEMDTLIDDDIDAGWEGADGDANILTAGLRFQNITIPKGATIDSAFIVVCSHEPKTVEDVAKLTIYAEAADHAATFSEDALITERSSTSAKVKWTVAEEWGLWTFHQTPDLKNIVQEIINRPAWALGNAIAFVISGENQGVTEYENAREWEAFENIADPEEGGDGANHAERVPRLRIYYTAPSYSLVIPIIKTGETQIEVEDDNDVVIDTITISISTDDAEQENDEIDTLIDDDIDAGWEGADGDANILTAGLRFQNITIPQGATIESAYIEITSHEPKTVEDVAKLTIYAEANDHAPTFTEDALISDRASTNAKVNWEVAEEWGLWTMHQTPELKSIVQEIINRSGWKSGNAIAFVITGENQGVTEYENAREWEAFENIADPEEGGDGANHADRVPKLHVTFSLSTSTHSHSTFLGNDLNVYPNPVERNQFMIKFNDSSMSEYTVNIYKLNGKLVRTFNGETDSNEVSFDVEGIDKGLYILKTVFNNTSNTQRIIIK
ncbi:MAG: T9SS type A sorting domain-containing protein [Prolixibacteraceae bacterium]|nr:T9SS type A sorting domain-containing protein [Prolixibacteraceae bacterium]